MGTAGALLTSSGWLSLHVWIEQAHWAIHSWDLAPEAGTEWGLWGLEGGDRLCFRVQGHIPEGASWTKP